MSVLNRRFQSMDRLTLEKGEEKVVYIPERIYKNVGFYHTKK